MNAGVQKTNLLLKRGTSVGILQPMSFYTSNSSKSIFKVLPAKMAHSAGSISVFVVLGHTSADAVKATAWG